MHFFIKIKCILFAPVKKMKRIHTNKWVRIKFLSSFILPALIIFDVTCLSGVVTVWFPAGVIFACIFLCPGVPGVAVWDESYKIFMHFTGI